EEQRERRAGRESEGERDHHDTEERDARLALGDERTAYARDHGEHRPPRAIEGRKDRLGNADGGRIAGGAAHGLRLPRCGARPGGAISSAHGARLRGPRDRGRIAAPRGERWHMDYDDGGRSPTEERVSRAARGRSSARGADPRDGAEHARGGLASRSITRG